MVKQTLIALLAFTKPVKLAVILSLFLFSFTSSAGANNWLLLAPGIDYQTLENGLLTPWSHIHAFRINLNYNQLSLITAKELDKPTLIEKFAQYGNALIAINGGFFDANYEPLGLRIYNYQQKNPIKLISWWGIFYIKEKKAYLSNITHFVKDKAIEFAIQSGPRLIINNQIPPLKPGRAERSALGITKDGLVIILITHNRPITTLDLAKIMQREPLNCIEALNLDGGSSSQLHAKINSFKLDIHGLSPISDAVLVRLR